MHNGALVDLRHVRMLLEQVGEHASVRGGKQEVEADTNHDKRLCAEPRLQTNLCGHRPSLRKKRMVQQKKNMSSLASLQAYRSH